MDSSSKEPISRGRKRQVNHTIEKTGRVKCAFLVPCAGSCGKILSLVFSVDFTEGGLMKCVILLASIGFGLASLSGCSILHKKHLRHAAVIDDSCGCGASVPASFEGIPSSTVIAPAPLPFSGPPPAPHERGVPLVPGLIIVRILTPPLRAPRLAEFSRSWLKNARAWLPCSAAKARTETHRSPGP